MGTVRAIDFEGSPIYDCTGQGPETLADKLYVTQYAIYLASEVETSPDFQPTPADSTLLLTQADDATTIVYLYAFDEEGNYDFCETYILIQLESLLLPQLWGLAQVDFQVIPNTGFDVYQNAPNPFVTETAIGFNLPADSDVVLTITDLAGRELLIKGGAYFRGYNSIELTKDMLQGVSGVLNYTITTRSHKMTKRMVVIW